MLDAPARHAACLLIHPSAHTRICPCFLGRAASLPEAVTCLDGDTACMPTFLQEPVGPQTAFLHPV